MRLRKRRNNRQKVFHTFLQASHFGCCPSHKTVRDIYYQHRQFVMSCMDTYNEPCSLRTACLASLGYFACLRCSVFLEARTARIAAICQNVSPCFISFIKVLSCEGECLYALLFKLIQFRHRI